MSGGRRRYRDDAGSAPAPPPVVEPPIVLPRYEAIPELSDGRVVLRRWTQRDAAVLVAGTRSATMRRFRLLPGPHSIGSAHRFIDACPESWAGHLHALWLAVADVATGEVVGGVHLLNVVPEAGRAQIGYWTLPCHHGRGFATAAASLLASWTLDALEVDRIQVETHVGNSASRRVAEKLGFTLEAVLRSHRPLERQRSDCVLYGLLAGDRRSDPMSVSLDGTTTTMRSAPSARRDPQVERLLHEARSDRPAATVSLPDRQPTLGDGVITLRPWRDHVEDVSACVAGCSDPATQRWLPFLPSPYTGRDAQSFLTMAATSWENDGDGHFAVVDAGGRHLGGARLHRAGDPAVAEIGYHVLPESRRRGVALAATRVLTRWALEELGFARAQIRADRCNEASVGVALKAGFTCEGTLRGHEIDRRGERRDDLIFSILAGEPR